MIKKVFKISVLALLVFTSCSKEDDFKEELITIENQQEPLTARQINDKINLFNQNGKKFYWKEASTHMLWSAVLKGNNLVTIGFGKNANDFDRSQSNSASQMQTEIMNLIKRYETNHPFSKRCMPNFLQQDQKSHKQPCIWSNNEG
jgi:hypothetical protein